MNGFALSLAFAPLSPWLLLQGRRVRRDTPRLPPAAGPQSGLCEGPDDQAALRIALFGESTVAGVGAASHDEALAGHLARALRTRFGRPVAWDAYGLSGASVAAAHANLLPVVAVTRVDLFVVVFGVNDVLEHTSPARYAARVAALVEALRARGGPAPVLLAGAPPMAQFPSLPRPLSTYLGARAALLDRAVARAAIANSLQVAAVLRIEPHLFADDGFHPSPAGYAAWADALAHAAQSMNSLS